MSDKGAMRPTLLKAEDVIFGYGPHPVLRGVNLEARSGDFIALAGPNGAGKTTLLHVLTGHLTPRSGVAELDGKDVAGLPRRTVARRIAYVPQRSDSVFPYTVAEVVLMGRHPYAGLAALDTEDDCRIAGEALEEVGLADAAGRRFEELSGGERQLVLIARALAQKTEIIILDEPAAFLDLRRQWEITELLGRRCALGSTVIATFHDLNLAVRRATHLAILHHGRIASSGKPEEAMRPEILEEIYGLPLRVETRVGQPPRVSLP